MQTKLKYTLGLALAFVGMLVLTSLGEGDNTNAPAIDAARPDLSSPPALAPVASPPQAAPVPLTPAAAEMAKLAQAGMGDDVMLAYVSNVKGKFGLGSDQIVYLNDLGINGAVIKAMIEHDTAMDNAARNYATSQMPPNIQPVSTNPPDVPAPVDDGSVPPMAPSESTAAINPPNNTVDYPVADDSDYFYNSLAPYGSWVYTAGFGLCWQPTVCRMNHDWRPYGDRGRWLDSDCGWYWQSDYSWGWAAFHYGRWYQDAHQGWLWAPGRVWAPAWVSWRRSQDHCGWAPLPPSARFLPGKGLAYANHLAGAGTEFGLQANHYTFIPVERLSDYAPTRYAVPASQAAVIYGQSANINHFTMENNRMVNHGIDPREVAALARTEIRRVEVVEMPRGPASGVLSDHVAKQGGSTLIYHPQLPPPSSLRAPRSFAPTKNPGNLSSPPGQPHASVSPTMENVGEQKTVNSSPVRPAIAPESFPPGSLIIIGKKNLNNVQAAPLPNMNFSQRAGVGSTALYMSAPSPNLPSAPDAAAWSRARQASGTVAAGFNFNGTQNNASYDRSYPAPQTALAPAESAFINSAHYNSPQLPGGNGQARFTSSEFTQERQPPALQERAMHEPRVETREPHPTESRQVEIAHAMQAAVSAHYASAPAPQAAPAPATSASSSSSSSSATSSSSTGRH